MKAKVIKTGEMVDVYHEPQHGQVTNIYKESVLVNGRMWSEDELDFCRKADEAPQKIYLIRNISTSTSLNTTNDCHEKYLQEWYKGREKDTDIEYTRTDVLIEKAVHYIANNMRCDGYTLQTKAKFIRDFKNYMKRELGIE